MRLFYFLGLLSLLLVGPAGAVGPVPFSPGQGGSTPGAPDPDACWSDVVDLSGYKISSEIISAFGLESELANDFELPGDPGDAVEITNVIVYGGEYGWAPGDPHFTHFNLKFYEDEGCVPGTLLSVYGHLEIANEFVGFDPFGYPTYRYEQSASVQLDAGVKHWFVIQADDHGFPPQWGRQSATDVTGCEGMFWSPFFGYPNWTPVTQLIGFPEDYSQEFECSAPVPVVESSWGGVRGLYR